METQQWVYVINGRDMKKTSFLLKKIRIWYKFAYSSYHQTVLDPYILPGTVLENKILIFPPSESFRSEIESFRSDVMKEKDDFNDKTMNK